MNGYFYVLTTIDIFVLCFMCVLTRLSESLNKKQKRGFFLAFILIAFISILEVTTLKVDGLPVRYRWINIISNYLALDLHHLFVSVWCMYWIKRRGLGGNLNWQFYAKLSIF